MGIKIGVFSGRFGSATNNCCTSAAAAFMMELFLFASVVFYLEGDFHHEKGDFIVTDKSGDTQQEQSSVPCPCGTWRMSVSLWNQE